MNDATEREGGREGHCTWTSVAESTSKSRFRSCAPRNHTHLIIKARSARLGSARLGSARIGTAIIQHVRPPATKHGRAHESTALLRA